MQPMVVIADGQDGLADANGSEHGLVLDRGQRHAGELFFKHAAVIETRGRPVNGGEQFRGADVAVVVGVDQRQRAGVELDPGGRAGQRDPQLLVEVLEVQQVGGGIDAYLVEAAGKEEFEGMWHVRLRLRQKGCCGVPRRRWTSGRGPE